jgi:3-oxoacyl-[acyl-carrier-protein] synthase II
MKHLFRGVKNNMLPNQLHRVAVTGLGAVCPLGLDVRSIWSNMIAGKSGVDYVTTFDTSNFDVKIAAERCAASMLPHISPAKQAQRMDRFTRFAVAASLQAVEAAGLTIDDGNREDTGVIIGTTVAGLLSVTEQMKILETQGPDRISPILAPTMSGDAAGPGIASAGSKRIQLLYLLSMFQRQ